MSQVHDLPLGYRPRRGATVAAALAAVLLGAAGCSTGTSSAPGSSGPPATLAPVQSGTVTISVRDNTFVPETVTVTLGSKIVWRNDGRTDHNIVAVGDTPFHVDTAYFAPKATYEYTPKKPGTYPYYCSIHGTSDKGMPGTVQVVPG
jgi:plastocyanin